MRSSSIYTERAHTDGQCCWPVWPESKNKLIEKTRKISVVLNRSYYSVCFLCSVQEIHPEDKGFGSKQANMEL